MHEQLLGYLLDALEPDERQALEQRLQDDPQLQDELRCLRASLQCLDHDDHEPEPPPGLAERTCQHVFARIGPAPGQFAATAYWRLQDVVVAGVVLTAAVMVLFPAVAQSRYQAQLRGCQANLARLGQALADYSSRHQGFFPEVPERGNLAVAGVYGPRLIEAGFLQARDLICPASELAAQSNRPWPSIAGLQAAMGPELRQLQALAGGSYGYSFGYRADGRYCRQRNQQRAHFAVMADAPAPQFSRATHSVLDLSAAASLNHGAQSQHVLFEDGHVQTFATHCTTASGDHIFTNHQGHVGAGIGPDDAVIATSAASPAD